METKLKEECSFLIQSPKNSQYTFKLSIFQTIKDLKDRLKRSRPFTPALEGVGFEYGFNSAQIDGWVKYWANDYQFKERETFLNQFPQFKTNVQGLDIHFIRVTPKVCKFFFLKSFSSLVVVTVGVCPWL